MMSKQMPLADLVPEFSSYREENKRKRDEQTTTKIFQYTFILPPSQPKIKKRTPPLISVLSSELFVRIFCCINGSLWEKMDPLFTFLADKQLSSHCNLSLVLNILRSHRERFYIIKLARFQWKYPEGMDIYDKYKDVREKLLSKRYCHECGIADRFMSKIAVSQRWLCREGVVALSTSGFCNEGHAMNIGMRKSFVISTAPLKTFYVIVKRCAARKLGKLKYMTVMEKEDQETFKCGEYYLVSSEMMEKHNDDDDEYRLIKFPPKLMKKKSGRKNFVWGIYGTPLCNEQLPL